MHFLVMGGKQRMSAVWKQKWFAYERALLLRLDTTTGKVETLIEYESPDECTAGKDASICFKAGSIYDKELYLCTSTEVLSFRLSDFSRTHRISLPCFNDLHHVWRKGDRTYIVSTGLDMVVTLDAQFRPVEYVNVLGKDPWCRFSPSEDYRKFVTTKPHESHPNYIFELNHEIWVTRFEQRDAVCLAAPQKRIVIGGERVHDGFVIDDRVYFTTVDGTIVVTDGRTQEIEDVFDINLADDRPNPLGWCRGLHIEGNTAYVGFSSLRSTPFRENLAWLKRGRFNTTMESQRPLPPRVVEYDLRTRTITNEFGFSNCGLAAVFSMIAVNASETADARR